MLKPRLVTGVLVCLLTFLQFHESTASTERLMHAADVAGDSCKVGSTSGLLDYVLFVNHKTTYGDSANYDQCDAVDIGDLAAYLRFLTHGEPELCQQSPTCSTVSGTDIEMVPLSGFLPGEKLYPGKKITIGFRAANNSEYEIYGITNGLRVFSPDGAIWYPSMHVDTVVSKADFIIDTTWYDAKWIGYAGFNWFPDIFDGGASVAGISSDNDSDSLTAPVYGSGSDTLGFSAVVWEIGFGYAPGLDMVVWSLSIDSVSASSVGKTICIDSAFYPAAGYWKWSAWQGNQYYASYPQWSGPYCFEIVVDCCEGVRGNINLDLQGDIDISDLTTLVGWMFKSGSEPPCMLEADVDGNGEHDIADVTYLVAYMFRHGPEPAQCP